MSKLVCLKRIINGGLRRQWGGLGAKLPAAGQFFFLIFWEKQAILMPLDHNLHVFRTILKVVNHPANSCGL